MPSIKTSNQVTVFPETQMEIVESSIVSGSITLEPRKHYVFGEVTNLTINLGIESLPIITPYEYSFQFDSPTGSLSTIALPSYVKFSEDIELVATPCTYGVYIIDNIATIKKIGEPPVEWVDLGLSVKWCYHNIGAENAEDYGLYFQWGDTVGYSDSSHSTWATCPFNNGSTSYNESYFNSVSGTVCPNGILALDYDAANVKMGEDWRMPTSGEVQELISNTTSTWETLNGVNGRRFTASNGNSIFIPAAGCCYDGSIYYRESYCYLWSSSLYESYHRNARLLSSYSWDCYMGSYSRYNGFSCRGVCP